MDNLQQIADDADLQDIERGKLNQLIYSKIENIISLVGEGTISPVYAYLEVKDIICEVVYNSYMTGYNEGDRDGYECGMVDGYDIGYDDGYAFGFSAGLFEGSYSNEE